MAYTTKIYFLIVLEARSPKIKVAGDSVSGKGFLPSFQTTAFSLFSHGLS
jgi:hypothetical protein